MNLDRVGGSRFPEPEGSFDRELEDSRTGIYRDLEWRILDLCLLRQSVEDEMDALVLHYARTIRPSRFRLFARRQKRGAPPKSLYWARLCRKPGAEFVGPGRRWWHRDLKIHALKELYLAVYRAGLTSQARRIVGIFERVNALNEAHRILARLSSDFARLPRSRAMRSAEGLTLPQMPVDPIFRREGMGRRGAWLLEPAWKVQGMVERSLEILGRLGNEVERMDLPVRLTTDVSMRSLAPALWWDPRAGTFHDSPPRSPSAGFPVTRAQKDEQGRIERDRASANRGLKQAVGILHRMTDRLLDAVVRAEELRAGCPRLTS
jgi:hypothetical protein